VSDYGLSKLRDIAMENQTWKKYVGEKRRSSNSLFDIEPGERGVWIFAEEIDSSAGAVKESEIFDIPKFFKSHFGRASEQT